ncbi:MAG: DMT family transporter [Acidobacteriota bacterium]|nr:DMT family transporter [Acidobacteriota bacterium]
MTSGLHRASGNPRVGLTLALSTALLWGFLAIALKLLLGGMDAFTITWYRMTSAALLLGGYQLYRRRLPSLGGIGLSGWGLLLVALLGLVGNYVLFVLALDYVPPATAQLVIQLAPILFLLGSLAIFRESFSGRQWVGLVILIGGLLLFFNERLVELMRLTGREAAGVMLVVVAAIVWAAYALAQKQLLVRLSSVNILLLIYIGAAILLAPFARPSSVLALTRFQTALLVFGIVNTLAAYGCFAEALVHWEASRVSAVIALTPLITIAAVYVILAVRPETDIGERLGTLGLAGAALIVAGSVMTALGKAATKAEPMVLE